MHLPLIPLKVSVPMAAAPSFQQQNSKEFKESSISKLQLHPDSELFPNKERLESA